MGALEDRSRGGRARGMRWRERKRDSKGERDSSASDAFEDGGRSSFKPRPAVASGSWDRPSAHSQRGHGDASPTTIRN